MSLPVGLGIGGEDIVGGLLEAGEILGTSIGVGLDLEDGIAVHRRYNCRFGRLKHSHTGLQLTIKSQLMVQTEFPSHVPEIEVVSRPGHTFVKLDDSGDRAETAGMRWPLSSQA